MFSVIFPGQGSQLVGMGKDLHAKYSLVQDLFKEADDILGFSISNLILNGPKEELDLTENTQPAIFLLSYSIFKLIKEEFKIDLDKAKFYAGHSLGEYSALTAAGALSFSDTLKILNDLNLDIGFRSNIHVDLKKKMKKINNTCFEIAREDHSNIIRLMKL